MKNIPNSIDNAFYCYYFNFDRKEYGLYLFDKYFSNFVSNYHIVYDRRNIPVKFGYNKYEKTSDSYKKLIKKDKIFKLSKKDLE